MTYFVTGENKTIILKRINKTINKLQLLFHLFHSNNLLSIEKTTAMSFHTWQKKIPLQPRITFYSIALAYKLETKFMGININENITWDVHIKYLSSKFSKSFYVIRLLRYSKFIYCKEYLACTFSFPLEVLFNLLGVVNSEVKVFPI
jgi:hypothetical protein